MTEATTQPAGIAKLAAALAKAQGAFRPIVKNRAVTIYSMKSNGSYTFRYADLEELLDATRSSLAANGLSVVQIISGQLLRTVLLHESGEQIASELQLGTAGGDDIKTFGAKISYLRRYAYQSLLCLAADDDLDEDGTEAGPVTRQQADKAAKQEAPKHYSDEQFEANLPTWTKLIQTGKRSHEEIISTVEAKAPMTDNQKKKIRAIQREQPAQQGA